MNPRNGGSARDWERHADVVVVGGGISGYTAALTAQARGLRVLVVIKSVVGDTATSLAQGGVAVVDGSVPADNVAAHVADTVTAGDELVDGDTARVIIGDGAAAIATLQARGAVFDRGLSSLKRTREGGHTHSRIIHAGGDATGAEIQRALNTAARELPVLEHHTVLALCTTDGTVNGVAVVDADGNRGLIHAPAVVLATGGAGQLYSVTTNPAGSTGDGVALALRAGASIADMEFMQFHPTMLFTPRSSGTRPLISEAVRGEGAVLVDAYGKRIASPDPRGDLASRDIVARAIATHMHRTGTDHVYLDATTIDGFAARFPTITAYCRAEGINPRTTPIPVAPGAHYHCGGVVTDAFGRTNVPGLFAIGEVARTGLHGANRLASNSLLEGAVMGERVVQPVFEDILIRPRSEAGWQCPRETPASHQVLQRIMSTHVGVVRDSEGLDRAANLVAQAEMQTLGRQSSFADQNLTLVAKAVIAAAQLRRETRGCHTRLDHPYRDSGFARSITLTMRDGSFTTDDMEAPVRA
ncbi:L-aspartate oxidase [Hoyosella rhizosphaerae]|uniref:L-aspartate oxidase n=1 Tax=Hoyosella rhizosphaerae TaxID=1755582 RepID=A0A916UEJ7_9ACTN|nr:L-aspartate oxidase [Hoyosella rhizosphaerae]MBN4925586.1 L-aspartate oxidase [Hoyosella rhizosphaerae]GGC69489.1 L-aspartate oxidase [Hoyosella rhizosphaerae]